MKKIRIGNDITLSIPLSGLSSTQVAYLTFRVSAVLTGQGMVVLNEHHHHHLIELPVTITNNSIVAVWSADDQEIGVYDIIVSAVTSSGSKAAGDVVAAIEIVKHTVDEADGDDSLINASTTVTLPTITLTFVTLSTGGTQKPQGGWKKTDLEMSVQTSLGKADSAIQDISGKQDQLNNQVEYHNDYVCVSTNKGITAFEIHPASSTHAGIITKDQLASLIQAISDIGTMSSLSTDATNLVAAINEVASKPSKPEAGWAKTDLDTSVQASINKADKVGDWSDIDLPVKEGEAQPENVVAALNMISGVDLASQFESRYVQAEGYADGTEQQSRWGKYRAAEASRTSAFNTAKTQKLSSYDTEFATLKAGYIPETLTSITGDVLDNKYYRLGTITSLDIDGLYEDDDEGNRTWLITHGTVIEFTAGTDADGNVCPITFPCQVYVNKSGDADSIGSLSAGIRYQMLLSYDNVTFVEFNSSTVNA